jgi:glycine cleavage system protein P-like pyridoxal-binding family
MKTFIQLREKLQRRPSGQEVFNKKIDRIPVKIHKEKAGFVVYIDGDRLDAYKSQKEAEKMAQQFVKTYKG